MVKNVSIEKSQYTPKYHKKAVFILFQIIISKSLRKNVR